MSILPIRKNCFNKTFFCLCALIMEQLSFSLVFAKLLLVASLSAHMTAHQVRGPEARKSYSILETIDRKRERLSFKPWGSVSGF